jgi:hypothetical protein
MVNTLQDLKEENIATKIFLIRGERVMLDSDLADIYGVTTSRLNEQVKRNFKRFPPDFMFELNQEEYQNLISQFATSSWGGRRKPPKVFTEHGAIMLASVLNSETAVEASIFVVRAFIKLREFVLMSKEISKKLEEFESKTDKKLDEHDKMFQVVFDTLKKVLIQEAKPKNPIGFITK